MELQIYTLHIHVIGSGICFDCYSFCFMDTGRRPNSWNKDKETYYTGQGIKPRLFTFPSGHREPARL